MMKSNKRVGHEFSLDGILVLLAAIQVWLLWDDPLLRDGQRPPWLIFPMLGTWIALMMGAMLSARKRGEEDKRAGHLPPETGLWLGAHMLLLALWLVIVFNIDDVGLWGFWHLERMDRAEFVVLACGLPLVLAPGARRGGRWLRRTWIRGKRRAPRVMSLLPWGLLVVYTWLMADHMIMSDGWWFAGMVRDGEMQAAAYREPLFIMILQALYGLIRPTGWPAAQFLQFMSAAAMFAALALIGWMMRVWGLSGRRRCAGWWLVFSSLGITQMLLGHVELYPFAQLGFVATLAGATGLLAGRCSPAWMTIAFALTLAGHLSAIFMLPAVGVALVLWARAAEPGGRWARAGRGLAHLAGWGVAIHGPLWFCLMRRLEPPTRWALIEALRTSITSGSEVENMIGSNAGSFAAQLGELFGTENVFKLAQAHCYLAGGATLALVLGIIHGMRGFEKNRDNAGTEQGFADEGQRSRGLPFASRRMLIVLGVAWAGYACYAFAWHADWPWSEDWDLFSPLAPLVTLTAMAWLLSASGPCRLPPRIIVYLCVFTLALGVSQHYYNHSRYASLSPMIKISRGKGALHRALQRYQMEHGWQRGMVGEWIDGRLVIHKEDERGRREGEMQKRDAR